MQIQNKNTLINIHILIVVSHDPLASRPSDNKHNDVTNRVCASNNLSHTPVFISQILIVVFHDPLASGPSDNKHNDVTSRECRSNSKRKNEEVQQKTPTNVAQPRTVTIKIGIQIPYSSCPKRSWDNI